VQKSLCDYYPRTKAFGLRAKVVCTRPIGLQKLVRCVQKSLPDCYSPVKTFGWRAKVAVSLAQAYV
jgi:hypothetical protein